MLERDRYSSCQLPHRGSPCALPHVPQRHTCLDSTASPVSPAQQDRQTPALHGASADPSALGARGWCCSTGGTTEHLRTCHPGQPLYGPQPHSPIPVLIPSPSCRTPIPALCRLQGATAQAHVLVGPQPTCSAGSPSTPKQGAQHTQPIRSLHPPAPAPAPKQVWMPCPKSSGI